MAWMLAPITADAVVGIVAGVAMLVLAAWTWHLHPRLAVNRVFAAFLVVRGLSNLTGSVGFTLAEEPGRLYLVGSVIDLFLAFALVPFLLAYRRHQHGVEAGRWVHVALVAGAVAMAALWLWNPAWGPYVPEGDPLEFHPGPLLGVVSLLYWGVLVGMGLALVRDATVADHGPAQTSSLLLALALMAFPVHLCTYIFYDVVTGGALVGVPEVGAMLLAVFIAPLVVVALSGFAATLLVYHGVRRRGRPSLGHARRFAVAALLPFLTAVVPAQALLAGLVERTTAVHALETLGALWVLAMPLLAAYALVRHQLFGVDAKVKFAVRQSTVAAAFVGVFFVVSEGAETVLSSRWGPALGIAAAGALVFAIAPLQRLAERVADAAMPGVHPSPTVDPGERAAIYRDQVRFAWADRTLSRDERRLLDQLRERLQLSAEEAVRIEGEVLRD